MNARRTAIRAALAAVLALAAQATPAPPVRAQGQTPPGCRWADLPDGSQSLRCVGPDGRFQDTGRTQRPSRASGDDGCPLGQYYDGSNCVYEAGRGPPPRAALQPGPLAAPVPSPPYGEVEPPAPLPPTEPQIDPEVLNSLTDLSNLQPPVLVPPAAVETGKPRSLLDKLGQWYQGYWDRVLNLFTGGRHLRQLLARAEAADGVATETALALRRRAAEAGLVQARLQLGLMCGGDGRPAYAGCAPGEGASWLAKAQKAGAGP